MRVALHGLREKENSQKEMRNQLSKAYRIADLASGSYFTKSNGIHGKN